jgi:hypothetical protein
MKNIPTSELILLLSVFFSIGFSLFLFIVLNEIELGIFIGLWAPTIMGFVNYVNLIGRKRK